MLGPLVRPMTPLIGVAAGDAKGQDHARAGRAPWRAWYKTKRWERLRLQVFVRDSYTCQRTGEMCLGKHPEPNSPVANHRVPHRGNAELFWDPGNIETVTKAVHDGMIQSEERAGDRER